MDCIVHGVTKSRTRLSDFHSHNVKHSQTLMTFNYAAYQSRFLFWVINSYKHLPFKILHWLFPWPLKFNIKMESHYFYSWACSFFDVAYVALEVVSTWLVWHCTFLFFFLSDPIFTYAVSSLFLCVDFFLFLCYTFYLHNLFYNLKFAPLISLHLFHPISHSKS